MSNRKRKSLKKFIILVFTGAIVILVILINNSLYNKSIKSALKDSKAVKTEEALKETIISEVNQLFELPKDEEVIIGTIQNIDELENKQEYFNKAKNGDLLLIYPDMTIIYDPKTKTIVDIAKVRLMK